MTISCQPMDATAGSPEYSAQAERQNMAPLYGGGSGLALAARSGFRVGTPSNILTATSTTWTLVPCSAVITPGAATAQGSYRWASDANVSGAMTPADATYARKDIVYIRVNDSSSGDGSGALSAPLLYLAGVANADPQPPDLPPRSFLVGTINVPQVGGGSPTVVLNPARFVAAGAKLPIASAGERALLVPYKGFEIQRTDLTQVDPCGVMERYNGASWDHFGHSEWTFSASGIPSATVWGTNVLTNDPTKTTDVGMVTCPGADRLTFRDAGEYSIDLAGTFGTSGNGRSFMQATNGSTVTHKRDVTTGDDSGGPTIPNLVVTAGQTIWLSCYITLPSGTTTWNGRVRIKRLS